MGTANNNTPLIEFVGQSEIEPPSLSSIEWNPDPVGTFLITDCEPEPRALYGAHTSKGVIRRVQKHFEEQTSTFPVLQHFPSWTEDGLRELPFDPNSEGIFARMFCAPLISKEKKKKKSEDLLFDPPTIAEIQEVDWYKQAIKNLPKGKLPRFEGWRDREESKPWYSHKHTSWLKIIWVQGRERSKDGKNDFWRYFCLVVDQNGRPKPNHEQIFRNFPVPFLLLPGPPDADLERPSRKRSRKSEGGEYPYKNKAAKKAKIVARRNSCSDSSLDASLRCSLQALKKECEVLKVEHALLRADCANQFQHFHDTLTVDTFLPLSAASPRAETLTPPPPPQPPAC